MLLSSSDMEFEFPFCFVSGQGNCVGFDGEDSRLKPDHTLFWLEVMRLLCSCSAALKTKWDLEISVKLLLSEML